LEASARIRIGEVRRENFDGGRPIELGASRAIHDTHAALPERRFDAVLAYVDAGGESSRTGRDERGTIRHGLVQGSFESLPVFLVALDRHTDRLGRNGR
jgi:hypothetical protein